MALVALTVRRQRPAISGSATNYTTSTEFAVDDSAIKLAIPSVCKKDGKVDGLVNSKATISIGGKETYLWCTETITEILALS